MMLEPFGCPRRRVIARGRVAISRRPIGCFTALRIPPYIERADTVARDCHVSL